LDKVPKIEIGEWIETRFVDAALKDMGVYGNFDLPGRVMKQ
jgi:hypothetical protein